MFQIKSIEYALCKDFLCQTLWTDECGIEKLQRENSLAYCISNLNDAYNNLSGLGEILGWDRIAYSYGEEKRHR